MSVLKMRCKKNLYSQDGQLLLSSGVDYDVTTGSKDYSGLINVINDHMDILEDQLKRNKYN